MLAMETDELLRSHRVDGVVLMGGFDKSTPALLLGAIVAAVLVAAVPPLTQSSLSNMDYWVDWANLLAIALGLGVLAALFVWPLAALACPRCRSAA